MMRIASITMLIGVFCGWLQPNAAAEGPEGMVYIPEGEFLMGTSAEQAETLARQYDVDASIFTGAEHPLHKVHVDAFYIDRYEVTNGDYEKFVKATGRAPSSTWGGPASPKELLDIPVTGIGWEDAKAYASWAGKRLPTEAEWEKAARGTDGRLYPWGNEWRDDACCMDGARKGGDPWGLAPVGSYPQDQSPYGVMDMAGNMAEWTADEADMTSWPGFALFKGGSYDHHAPYSFRCASRVGTPPGNSSMRGWYVGFRCAKDIEGTEDATEGAATAIAPPAMSGTAVHVAEMPTPKPELYLKEPLKLHNAGFKVGLRAPYLPGNEMQLNVLEGFDPKEFDYVDERTVNVHWVSEDKHLTIDVELRTDLDFVDTIYRFNNTDQKVRTVAFSICCETYHSPLFRDHEGTRNFIMTRNGPKSVNDFSRETMGRSYYRIGFSYGEGSVAIAPFTMTGSRDGEWVVSQVSKEADRQFNNLEGGCQHSIPEIEVEPGKERTVKQRIYVMRGGPEDVIARWQREFNTRLENEPN